MEEQKKAYARQQAEREKLQREQEIAEIERQKKLAEEEAKENNPNNDEGYDEEMIQVLVKEEKQLLPSIRRKQHSVA